MPKIVEFEIKGLKELQEKLEELPKKMADRVLRKALKVAAKRVKEAFASAAPRDTGLLSENFVIKTRARKADVAAFATVGPDGKVDYPRSDSKNDAGGE